MAADEIPKPRMTQITQMDVLSRLPRIAVAFALLAGVTATVDAQVGNTPGSGFTTIIGSAMRYVMAYEQKFALLAADETYVQELQRPPNPGDNLSRRDRKSVV